MWEGDVLGSVHLFHRRCTGDAAWAGHIPCYTLPEGPFPWGIALLHIAGLLICTVASAFLQDEDGVRRLFARWSVQFGECQGQDSAAPPVALLLLLRL